MPARPAHVSRLPRYRALYDFETAEPDEMPLTKGDIVELEDKEGHGWWLVKKNGVEGWSPADYLELVPEAAKSRPPPPPAKPPVGAKPATAPKSTAQPVPSWSPADAHAAPMPVMPGMGEPGGFAAVLARKKAERAAAEAQPPP